VTTSIRRARNDDVDFLVELGLHEDVEPFLSAVSAKDREAVAAEVERSQREPHDFGRFVIEVDGERAGAMGFELANRRSRVAHLERLAVHPSFRGRRIADEAARALQRHLVVDLGYHRLQLEIYGFNERAIRHAERAGFVREGVRRRADVSPEIRLLHDSVMAHNEAVRTGEWDDFGTWFAEDAELVFDGVPFGPFRGGAEVEAAYRDHPPDDEVLTFDVRAEAGLIVAHYGWRREPSVVAGRMLLTPAGGRIAKLVVTFEP